MLSLLSQVQADISDMPVPKAIQLIQDKVQQKVRPPPPARPRTPRGCRCRRCSPQCRSGTYSTAAAIGIADCIDCGHLQIGSPLAAPSAWRAAQRVRRRPQTRVPSHCRFALLLIHFIPYLLIYSVRIFPERQCDRTLPFRLAAGRRGSGGRGRSSTRTARAASTGAAITQGVPGANRIPSHPGEDPLDPLQIGTAP